ncbi:hypothetical protein WMY93_016023 [Mugilogobius chulae]|uniref:DUF4550 domain-containing protein n=1 Tax=Mugilogobius chulae TaxID=88201 RepID=A0AAW0P204_9GOBI
MENDDISEDSLPFSEKTFEDDIPYYITWTVCIALAFPQEEAEVCKVNERKKNFQPCQGCYHIEYKLLPGDAEAVKLDLLLFGPVAKLYKEDESKIIQTWTEEGQTWVGWIQDFNIKVHRDMAIHLLHHKITVHIWNHKKKPFNQTDFDRQKPLKLTQDLIEDTETCGDVKSIVTKIRLLGQKTEATRQHFHSTLVLKLKDKHITVPETAADDQASEVGIASVQLSPMTFLAGEQSLTNWGLVGSCGVDECMIHISLEKPLLSDELKAELNPLAITILSASSMPFTPLPFHVLEEKCMPVYCQYKFHNLQMHKTNYATHGHKISFRDVNVIFAGLMNPQDLYEFLSGPPMTIEIHDRDRKQDDKTPDRLLSCGFNGISSGVTSKCKTEDFNYHGVARLSFSKLLLGTTNAKVSLPIKCCTPPPGMDIARDLTVLPGHYIDSNSELKVSFTLACPLKLDLCEALFGRVVCMFNNNNFAMMDKLRLEILKSNKESFKLETENALSNYTAYYKHSHSSDLDYVTGFHLVDKTKQILVVEGLRYKAVRRIWEFVSMKLSGSKEEQVVVLYSSSLAFFKRIYDTLDLSLTPIILPESLEIIMKEPLIYVKGTIPPLCLQGLLRLSQLCQTRCLENALQYNLFPSAEMIQCLRRQYETPAQHWRQVLGVMEGQEGEQTPVVLTSQSTRQKSNIKENSHIIKDMGRSGSPKTLSRFTYSQEYCSATVEPGEYTVTKDVLQTHRRCSHSEARRMSAGEDISSQSSAQTCEEKSNTGPAPKFKFHMTNTDKFHNLLKDEPQKYSLRKPGMLLKPIPHLSVLSLGEDVTDVQRSSALAPGPCVDYSLSSRNNAIPRHSTEFYKYHYL